MISAERLWPQKENFVQPARDRVELYRILLTIVIFLAIYGVLLVAMIAFGQVFLGENEVIILQATQTFTTPGLMVLVLLTFWGWVFGLWVAARLVHRRGLLSMLWPVKFAFLRNFLLAAFILWGLVIVSSVLFPLPDDVIENQPFAEWIRWMPLAVPLILIQVSAEELLFRGYLQQQLGARFDSFWVWMVLPSVLFGMAHYDPSQFGSNAWLVCVQTTLLALLLADITMRTGNLGAAIGLHFANNMVAMCFVTFDGVLSGFARYLLPISPDDVTEMYPLLITEVSSTIVVLLVYTVVVYRRASK